MRRLLVCLLGFAVFAAFADQSVYKVTGDVAGVDLLADSETYYTDRIEGPVPGTNYTVNGVITHGALSTAAPFQFISDANATAGSFGTLQLNHSGLDSSTPMSFSGYGLYYFQNVDGNDTDADYVIENRDLDWSANPNLQVDDKAGVRFSRVKFVADEGREATLLMRPLANETRIRGVASGCGNRGFDQFLLGDNGKPGHVTLVFDNAEFFFADYPYFGAYGTPSTTVISNTVFESYYMHFGSWAANDGSKTSVTNEVVLAPGGVFAPMLFDVQNDPALKIVFDGGVFRSRHGGSYSMGIGGRSAVLLRTTPGNDFNIEITGSYVDLYQKGQNFDLSGPGNLVKTGAGALKFSAPVAYEGETYVNGGTIEVFDDNALPAAPVHLANGTKMALYNSRQEVPSIDGLGLVTSPDGKGTLAIGDGTDFTLTNVASTVSIAKRGSGTMTMLGTYGKHLGVEEGKAIVKVSDAAKPHRYWRFKVDNIRGSVNMMQFSELKLFSNGVDVTSSADSVSWDTDPDRKSTRESKNYPDGENPTKAYDGNVDSKWLDWRAGVNEPAEVRDSVWLMFDYGTSPVVINGYEWYTANDENPRDPVSWRLQYSDDASTWTILDAQSNYPVPQNRKVLAYSYNNIIGKGGTLEWVRVAADASLELDGCDLSAKSFDFPTNATVNIVNGGALELAAAAGEDADSTFGAIVSDETANAFDLRKTGAGTNTVLTARSLAARLDVQAGVLKITAVPESKFFRWTVKRVRGNNDIMQLSEFSLYDKDGNRLNANLAKVDPGTAEPYEMAPGSVTTPVTYSVGGSGSENFDKVVDGNTATKWCLTNNTMNDPGNESTWRTLVMRLPADAANVVSYSFTTANDSTPARNPSTWVLEASADGRTWQVVDERTDVGATPTSTFTESARFEVARSTAAVPTEDAFAAGSVVSVASGARLVLDDNGTSSIKNMVVDATIGGGTIEGFKAAQTGTIDIVNIPGTLSELYESTIFTVVNPAEYTSLAGWTVKIDGVSVDSRLKITPEGDVKFAERGFMVIFR